MTKSRTIYPSSMRRAYKGFTLLEMLIVVAIIGILAAIVLNSLGGVREKARDAKRRSEVSQFGRMLSLGCYVPDAGIGEYDLKEIADEMLVKNPSYSKYLSSVPKDPKSGTDLVTNYKYTVNASGKCALYANLENEASIVNLPSVSSPTPGGGTGVFAGMAGWNGSTKYFQVSN